MNNCEFCILNNETNNKYLLAESKHWKIYLADEQNYPGRCIIPLKRHAATLSDLTLEEWTDLHQVIAVAEAALIEELGATNLNWTCLMNGGYATIPSDPHVHFHLIPRYRNKVEIADQTFIDENFGDHYEVGNAWRVSLHGRAELVKVLSPVMSEKLSCKL